MLQRCMSVMSGCAVAVHFWMSGYVGVCRGGVLDGSHGDVGAMSGDVRGGKSKFMTFWPQHWWLEELSSLVGEAKRRLACKAPKGPCCCAGACASWLGSHMARAGHCFRGSRSSSCNPKSRSRSLCRAGDATSRSRSSACIKHVAPRRLLGCKGSSFHPSAACEKHCIYLKFK